MINNLEELEENKKIIMNEILNKTDAERTEYYASLYNNAAKTAKKLNIKTINSKKVKNG